MQASVFIATSLDGYIARKDGDISWLPMEHPEGEDFGYGALMASVDVLVMGRNTYDKCMEFPEWPYGDRRVVVLTSRPLAAERGNVETASGSPAEVLASLEASGATHAYVDGGVTIQRFLEAGLIDRMTITRIPILLGSGLPLFGPLSHDVKLDHESTRSWENGFVQSVYRVRR